ncbi:MAG: DUF2079 domain-containing protein [Nostocaceae cyanobacterium]|nr:DUF2079 domain-containing protein [Nostocaceae cyanobacterium]
MVLQRLNERCQKFISNEPSFRIIFLLSGIFFSFILVFSLHRFYSFYASYDQALFDQLFWNSIQGRWFQGSLSSGQSSSVMFDNQIHTVSYCHLGQHFVIDFLLWIPIYALFPTGATLVVLQVALITAAGLVLYFLARYYLPPEISILIAASFYGAIAVIGTILANFYEHCQIPLFVFSLLLALEKRKWWLFWLFVFLTLGIREETGIILFGIGMYLVFSRRYPRLGLVLCLLSFSYVTIVTNKIMPLFSNDNSRLYLTAYFGKFLPGNQNPSTLQLLGAIFSQPDKLLASLLTPVDRRLTYFLGHWLPLIFVPALSPAAWIITAPPLFLLFIQQGKAALTITLRYSLTVVPGLFYGTVLWWSQHQNRFTFRIRRWWMRCIAISIIISIISSPNQAFYFAFPDSLNPWVQIPLTRQWEHVGHIRSLMQFIPQNARVSATTYLLPHLATRREIMRLPALQIRDDTGTILDVDYVFADLWQLQQYQKAFKSERERLRKNLALIDKILVEKQYGIIAIQDGVVLLQKQVDSQPQAITSWLNLRKVLESTLQSR